MEAPQIQSPMTPAMAAEVLGISVGSVCRAIKRKSLKAFRPAGSRKYWLIHLDELEKYRKKTQPDGVPQAGRPRKKRTYPA